MLKLDVNMENSEGELIPGLPNDVAELCLLRLPFRAQSAARCVSKSWRLFISHPDYFEARKAGAFLAPQLFVYAFHRSSLRAAWVAFDIEGRCWCPLPPMPGTLPPCLPASVACAALPGRGTLFVLGGLRSDADAPTPLPSFVAYTAATNSWSAAAPMPTPRSFFAAAAIGGRIIAAGGTGPLDRAETRVDCYDPSDEKWGPAASMRTGGMPTNYNAAAVGSRLFITEGWSWPFTFSPRGLVYDADSDAWSEMPAGMCDGWAGAAFSAAGRLFVVCEYGDCRMKVYSEEGDVWQNVIGRGLPPVLKKPFVVRGEAAGVYVVGSGLSVGIGRLGQDQRSRWSVEWEEVAGPPGFGNLAPSHCEVLYV